MQKRNEEKVQVTSSVTVSGQKIKSEDNKSLEKGKNRTSNKKRTGTSRGLGTVRRSRTTNQEIDAPRLQRSRDLSKV